MFEAIEADGVLVVTQTDQCAYYATYDNYLAIGPGNQEYTIDSVVIIRVIKGGRTEPEIIEIEAWGVKYSATVSEWERGELCVPWPMIG